MASKRPAQENPEDYVKNYQLEILVGKLEANTAAVVALQKQVSDYQLIMQTRPTNEQVDDKIKAAIAGVTKDTDSKFKLMELTLGPPVRTSNKLLWGILASGLTLLGALALVALGLLGR